MSFIGKLFSAVLGGAPKTSGASAQQLTTDRKSAAASRTQLYGTEGGILGDELSTSEVKRRPTLFGN